MLTRENPLLDQLLRRLVPSTVLLTRSTIFAGLFRVMDIIVRPLFKLLTNQPIPPLKLMVRVGGGNNIFIPHYNYLTLAAPMWLYFFKEGFATLDSRIVEIGSGVGRSAVPLRDFNYADERFQGRYHGFDIDLEMVQWCQEHFPSDHFEFTRLDMHNTIYNPDGPARNKPRLSCKDNSVDFVYSTSLFTHLLEGDIRHYISESHRVLKPEGVMFMTFFCIDDLEHMQVLGGRWTFRHRLGNSYIEDRDFPESAVAYEKEWMLEIARSCGFSRAHVVPDHYSRQSILKCVK